MKLFLVISMTLLWSIGLGRADKVQQDKPNGNNIFIITLDGFRWQELFAGADSSIIHDPAYTPVTSYSTALFWDKDLERRREKLMPFVWNVIAEHGQIMGNRKLGSKVNAKNFYSLSYPGYNEIFTGDTDAFVSTNKKVKNRNVNLLEFLNKLPPYAGKVAAFTSWDAFPYILNTERSKIYINSGYEDIGSANLSKTQKIINSLQRNPLHAEETSRNDMLTFLTAKEYIQKNHPKIVYVGLGGTDESAHDKEYGKYLKEANTADRIIADLWNMVETSSFYKNNTAFIITTDHGRGSNKNTWHKHGVLVDGSSQTWMMLLGKGVKPLGEYKGNNQLYQKQIAGTVGYLLGVQSYSHKTIPAVSFEDISE